MGRPVCITLACALLFAPSTAAAQDRPEQLYESARAYWKDQRYDEAIPVLERIADHHLDSDVAEYAVDLLLDALVQTQRYDELVVRVNALLEHDAFLKDKPELAQRLGEIQQQSRRKDAERAEKDGNYERCGEIYAAIYTADPKADHADEVLYNAAICHQMAGDLGLAIALRDRIVTLFPKSRLAMRSWVLLANDHATVADYRRAAERLEGYARRYAGEKDAPDALMNAIVYRRALGDIDLVVTNVELFIKQYRAKRKDDAAAAMFSLTGLYRGRDDAVADKSLRRYLKSFGSVGGQDREIIAMVELGRIAWDQSCRKPDRGLCPRKRSKRLAKQAREWLSKALAADARFRGSARDDLAAFRAQSLRDAVGAAKLCLADAKLEPVLRDAKASVDDVEQAYLEVVQTKSARWAVAAQARRGRLFEARGEADKAVDQFAACLATASDALVDSEWVQLCDERVARVRPKAAAPRERRGAPTVTTPVLSRPKLQR